MLQDISAPATMALQATHNWKKDAKISTSAVFQISILAMEPAVIRSGTTVVHANLGLEV